MKKHTTTHLTLHLTSTVNSCTIKIRVTEFAAKQMERLPISILKQVRLWIAAVESEGLFETRKLPGYHDEPLKGKRQGQRSIRLNRAWRLIYEESKSENETNLMVIVIEVNKHEY